jgi:hypothetical protein
MQATVYGCTEGIVVSLAGGLACSLPSNIACAAVDPQLGWQQPAVAQLLQLGVTGCAVARVEQ